MTDPNVFKCAMCGGVFDKEWTDEEAQEEFQKLFPHGQDEPTEVVCDDCFQEVKPEWANASLEASGE